MKMFAKSKPVAEVLAEEISAPAIDMNDGPAVSFYTHEVCGTTYSANGHTKDETHLPCPTCGSVPPQKEFTWS